MKYLLKTILFLVMLTASTNLSALTLLKKQTDFIIVKDAVNHLRHEISTYKYFCLASNSNWGVLTETRTFDVNNRLVKKILKEEKVSRKTRDLPHIVIEKVYFYRKGVKTRMTVNKRISDGYSTFASKEIIYHKDGSKTKTDHTKGLPKKNKDPKYENYAVRRN